MSTRIHRRLWCGVIATLLSCVMGSVAAGPVRDWLKQGRAQGGEAEPSARVLRDIAYGEHRRQTFDVYLPPTAGAPAPVIFMVHGGAWSKGDKAHARVVDHKVERWLPRGFIFISVNYRLLPEADPLTQADDVRRALAFAQSRAASWGGDAGRFIVAGHSAGAHLVSLLATRPQMARLRGVQPWLGTIALDTAVFDLERLMRGRHAPMYDQAFGKDETYWREASPFEAMSAGLHPLLAVCSSQRAQACRQAEDFARAARAAGNRVDVLPQDLSHGEINKNLGLDGAYTEAVEHFMATLDAGVAERLRAPSGRGVRLLE